jgi:hypothetical protein
MPRSSLRRGRRLLLVGFGGLLALMLAGGIDSLVRLRQVNMTEADIREVYLHRAHSLEQIRSGIYQSSIVLRDYMLAGDPQSAAEQARKWNEIRIKTDQAVAQSAADVEPEEVPFFQSLRNEVRDYWKLRESVVLTPDAKGNNPYASGDLVQRRTKLLALIDRIDQINQRDLDSADRIVNAAFDALRWRTLLKIVLVMGVGICLAVFTVRRTLRMETELQQR